MQRRPFEELLDLGTVLVIIATAGFDLLKKRLYDFASVSLYSLRQQALQRFDVNFD